MSWENNACTRIGLYFLSNVSAENYQIQFICVQSYSKMGRFLRHCCWISTLLTCCWAIAGCSYNSFNVLTLFTFCTGGGNLHNLAWWAGHVSHAFSCMQYEHSCKYSSEKVNPWPQTSPHVHFKDAETQYAQFCKNMTSFTKPEVHNVWQCRHRRHR